MATVDITEYDRLATDNSGARIAAGVEPSKMVQQLAVSGVSAATAAFDENTRTANHTASAKNLASNADPKQLRT